MADDELVGINEIAALAKVSKQAVANWRARALDFPKPIAELASGPVFRRSQVRSWLRKRKVPMAHVLSTINLKGGVAKTTTTIGLATLAFFAGGGGLGEQIYSERAGTGGIFFKSNVVVAGSMAILLAAFGDLIILTVQRIALPWRRTLAT